MAQVKWICDGCKALNHADANQCSVCLAKRIVPNPLGLFISPEKETGHRHNQTPEVIPQEDTRNLFGDAQVQTSTSLAPSSEADIIEEAQSTYRPLTKSRHKPPTKTSPPPCSKTSKENDGRRLEEALEGNHVCDTRTSNDNEAGESVVKTDTQVEDEEKGALAAERSYIFESRLEAAAQLRVLGNARYSSATVAAAAAAAGASTASDSAGPLDPQSASPKAPVSAAKSVARALTLYARAEHHLDFDEAQMFEFQEEHIDMIHAAKVPLQLNKGLALLRLFGEVEKVKKAAIASASTGETTAATTAAGSVAATPCKSTGGADLNLTAESEAAAEVGQCVGAVVELLSDQEGGDNTEGEEGGGGGTDAGEGAAPSLPLMALTAAREALRIDPKHVKARCLEARSFQALGRHAEALDSLDHLASSVAQGSGSDPVGGSGGGDGGGGGSGSGEGGEGIGNGGRGGEGKSALSEADRKAVAKLVRESKKALKVAAQREKQVWGGKFLAPSSSSANTRREEVKKDNDDDREEEDPLASPPAGGGGGRWLGVCCGCLGWVVVVAGVLAAAAAATVLFVPPEKLTLVSESLNRAHTSVAAHLEELKLSPFLESSRPPPPPPPLSPPLSPPPISPSGLCSAGAGEMCAEVPPWPASGVGKAGAHSSKNPNGEEEESGDHEGLEGVEVQSSDSALATEGESEGKGPKAVESGEAGQEPEIETGGAGGGAPAGASEDVNEGKDANKIPPPSEQGEEEEETVEAEAGAAEPFGGQEKGEHRQDSSGVAEARAASLLGEDHVASGQKEEVEEREEHGGKTPVELSAEPREETEAGDSLDPPVPSSEVVPGDSPSSRSSARGNSDSSPERLAAPPQQAEPGDVADSPAGNRNAARGKGASGHGSDESRKTKKKKGAPRWLEGVASVFNKNSKGNSNSK